MNARAYYNEVDPYVAQYLRNLIGAGLIAPGDVDERSIVDVRPDDLRNYTQCHFFAGEGVWSGALRRAGWPDDRPVWTGSCPCQPFSDAGQGKGFDDERHLWPAFFALIAERRPVVCFGEQVASKDALAWLDVVQSDLEATDYAVGTTDFCSASVGAPHIRQRLYWVADAGRLDSSGRGELRDVGSPTLGDQGAGGERERLRDAADDCGLALGLADTSSPRHQRAIQDAEGEARNEARMFLSGSECGPRGVAHTEHDEQREGGRSGGEGTQRIEPRIKSCGRGGSGGMGDASGEQQSQVLTGDDAEHKQRASEWGRTELASGAGAGSGTGGWDHRGGCEAVRLAGDMAEVERPGPVNGFWGASDWLRCRDERWRPVEPGTFPLAHGAPARVGRLRTHGNAINLIQASEFISAYRFVRGEIV
ncbi:DNA cytosine methyltransferase [Verrucomicrobium sp. GAS474]|uniref:DNA cytosine methyltransferase n=1 Tax=Verrucomicrobium sp. GAS474 TaxID=1882831 RepID=UPI000B83AD95